jgi:hypothetical protein
VTDYVSRLERLVRWLALPYGENVPIFPHEDQYGNPLPASVELEETYREVVHVALCELCGEKPVEPGYKRCVDHW